MKQKTNSNSLFSLLFGFDSFYFPLLTKIWSDRKRKKTISSILAKMKFFSLKREFFPVFFSFKKRLFIAFFEQSADFETSKKQPLGKRNISPTELAENLFNTFWLTKNCRQPFWYTFFINFWFHIPVWEVFGKKSHFGRICRFLGY